MTESPGAKAERPGESHRHRLLDRQLRRVGLSEADAAADPRIAALLAMVSSSYDDADQYRYLNDRAFELSGHEMLELHERLRQATDSQLAHERDRLEAIFESVATGLVVVTARGEITALNHAARALLRLDVDAPPGLPLHDALMAPPGQAETAQALDAMREAFVRGVPWRGIDLEVAVSDGHRIPAALAFSPLFEDGAPAGGVLAISDVSERLSAAAELAWRAEHDALTGLLNRTALMDQLTDATAAPGARVGLLFIDLDRFKLVNDTLGHAAGDLLLMTVVDRIRAVVRDQDTLARLGGDEFVIVCREVSSTDEVMAVAERVVAMLAEPVSIGTDVAFVSASVGVTVSTEAADAHALLRDADVALYRAKDAGRSCAVLFDPVMRNDVAERVRLERQLRQALDAEDLSLAFQPVFRTSDAVLAGFETLVRWEGPGFHVEPTVFVPLAEDTGLVGALGAWVMESAGEFLDSLYEAGIADLSLAVNLSALQLGDPELPDRVASLVARMKAPPWRLMLEITETALLAEPDAARDRIAGLRATGVRVSLDDFGTGYSPLSALRSFGLDGLKIDRSFIAGLAHSDRDRTIVSGVTSMGHALGMVVVAEGIETEDQLWAAVELGCDRVQGYALGYPLTPDDAFALAASPRRPRWTQAEGISIGPFLAAGK